MFDLASWNVSSESSALILSIEAEFLGSEGYTMESAPYSHESLSEGSSRGTGCLKPMDAVALGSAETVATVGIIPVACVAAAVATMPRFPFDFFLVQVDVFVAVLSFSTLQPKIVAHVALVDVDVLVDVPDTIEVIEVVVEQIDALLVSQGLSVSE